MSESESHKIPLHSSLVFRSMISVFILLVVIIGTVSVLSISNLREEMTQQREQEGAYVSGITAQALGLPMWNLDKAQVQQQLESLRGSTSFCGARALDSRDYVFANAAFPETPGRGEHIYKRDIVYDDPRASENRLENLGRLELCLSDRDMEARLSDAVNTQMLYFTMITIAVLGAYYISLLIIVRPLLHIRSAMEELATTMKPIREASLTKRNEIGALSHSFNRMVISLAKTYNALKISRERAIQADHAKTEFLANMSHELRTPLNIIIGMTQIMDKPDMPDDYRESYSLINRSSQTLLTIVNDILDLTKIEAGEMRLENITFDLGMKVEEVGAAMTKLAAQKGLGLVCQCAIRDLIVMGDPLRFERILVNLIGNAVRYTEGGSITLNAHFKEGDYNQIRFFCEITDTGIGIAEDKLDKVFDKFSQADSSTTRRYGGTGLGLTITKQLVEMMGGKIGVESEFGKGTTFWFQIPFVLSDRIIDAQPQPAVPDGPDLVKAPSVAPHDARILLAEDNEINRAFMTKLLHGQGIGHVDWVANGRDAVARIQAERYDLVLMDCNMPEMSGYEAAAIIRAMADEAVRNVPIVALTANALSSDRDRCLALGMNGYLSKPFRLEEFTATLSNWIRFDKAA